MPNLSYPPAPVSRDVLLRVRVTADEKAQLAAMAAQRGRSISEVVRLALQLDNRQGQRVLRRTGNPFVK